MSEKQLDWKKWRAISRLLSVVGAVPIFIGALSENIWGSGWTYLGLGILVVAFMVSVFKMRCPSCNRHLSDRSPWDLEYCPYCGDRIKQKK